MMAIYYSGAELPFRLASLSLTVNFTLGSNHPCTSCGMAVNSEYICTGKYELIWKANKGAERETGRESERQKNYCGGREENDCFHVCFQKQVKLQLHVTQPHLTFFSDHKVHLVCVHTWRNCRMDTPSLPKRPQPKTLILPSFLPSPFTMSTLPGGVYIAYKKVICLCIHT